MGLGAEHDYDDGGDEEETKPLLASPSEATTNAIVPAPGYSDQLQGNGSEVVMTLHDVYERIGFGKQQLIVLFICGLCFCTDSIEVGLLAFLQVKVKETFNLSDGEESTLTSVVFAGEMVGSIIFGPLADKFGRKISSFLSALLVAAAGIASAFSPTYIVLLVLRFVVGVGVGGMGIPFDLLAEFLPPRLRGKSLIGVEFFWTGGTMFVNGLAWGILNRMGWRYLVAFCSIPVTVALASFSLMPESPHWLLAVGKPEKALKVIHKAAKLNKAEHMLPANLRLVKASQQRSESSMFLPIPVSQNNVQQSRTVGHQANLSSRNRKSAGKAGRMMSARSLSSSSSSVASSGDADEHASLLQTGQRALSSIVASDHDETVTIRRAASREGNIQSAQDAATGNSRDNGVVYRGTFGEKTTSENGEHGSLAVPHVDADHEEESHDPRQLFRKSLRWTTICLWTVWGMSGIAYYGTVIVAPEFFSRNSKDPNKFDYPSMFVIAAAELVGCIVAFIFIEKLSRKKFSGAGYIVNSITTMLLAIKMGRVPGIVLLVIARGSILLATSTTWVLTPELYPTSIRSVGHLWCSAVTRLGAFATPYWGDASNIKLGLRLLGYGIVAGLSGVFTFLLPKETKGADLA